MVIVVCAGILLVEELVKEEDSQRFMNKDPQYMRNFEYIGGNIWSYFLKDDSVEEYPVISVEIERGKIPFIVAYDERNVTKEILDLMLELVYSEMTRKEYYENS